MEYRNGTCASCEATYKIPASFTHDRARCKECGGTVEIGSAVSGPDSGEAKLELVISEGLPKEIEDLDLYIEREGSGISGYVALTGESYISRDVSADERFLPGLDGARSSLTVPLKLNEKVIGIMDVESQQARAFSDEDRQFGEIFGRHIAIALHMLTDAVVVYFVAEVGLTELYIFFAATIPVSALILYACSRALPRPDTSSSPSGAR